MRKPRAAAALAALLAAFALSACASGAAGPGTAGKPEPRPSVAATPSPSAAAAGQATTLRFSGSGVQALDSAGTTVAQEQFANGAGATVRLVSDALGAEPMVADNAAECAAANTSYQWDGLLATEWTGGSGFILTLSAPTGGDVRLETTGGFAPGDDVAAFVGTLPETSVGRPGGSDLFVAFDVVSTTTDGEYTSPVGAVGYVPDGATLQTVVTPGQWSSFLC
jgi:hypothetical protein